MNKTDEYIKYERAIKTYGPALKKLTEGVQDLKGVKIAPYYIFSKQNPAGYLLEHDYGCIKYKIEIYMYTIDIVGYQHKNPAADAEVEPALRMEICRPSGRRFERRRYKYIKSMHTALLKLKEEATREQNALDMRGARKDNLLLAFTVDLKEAGLISNVTIQDVVNDEYGNPVIRSAEVRHPRTGIHLILKNVRRRRNGYILIADITLDLTTCLRDFR